MVFKFASFASRLTALSVIFCGISARAALIPTEQRVPAPPFAVEGSTGTTLHLSDWHGRVLLLDFWATTCGGCKIEIPWYIDYTQRFGAQGLSALGIATDDDWKLVRPYLAQHPIDYPIALGSDLTEKVYKVESLPMTLLIDRKGRIAASHVGMVDREEFAQEITTLLKE